MRLLIISFCLMLFCVIAGAQDFYYVTVIRGAVKKEDKSILKTGDKLLEDAKLIFANKDCRLLLLHPQKGRFVLEPEKISGEPKGELLLFLKNKLHLQTQTMRLSSRGDIGVDDFFLIKNPDSANLLFIGDTKFDLRYSGYLQADTSNNFFFLQYSAADGKVYNNKLSIMHDSLNFNKSSFLFNGIMPANNRKVKIGYIKDFDHNREIKQIAAFVPIFMSAGDCQKMMGTIKQTIGGSKEKIIEEAYIQLYFLYGKPFIETLNSIFDQL